MRKVAGRLRDYKSNRRRTLIPASRWGYPRRVVKRILLFVFLALIPPTLFGALIWKGRRQPPMEKMHAPATPVPAGAALRALFASDLGPAKIKEKVTYYDEKGLFEYIDGAAPIFIERHFRELGAAELDIQGSDIVCDVYDMATATNAQSIFAAEKSATAAPLEGWPEAISGSMSFVFHHNQYYVKLTAFDAKAEAALPVVARALREKMQ